MDAVSIIRLKRDGGALSDAQIDWVTERGFAPLAQRPVTRYSLSFAALAAWGWREVLESWWDAGEGKLLSITVLMSAASQVAKT